MTRVIDPAVADLQHEHREAGRSGRPGRRIRVLARGYASILLACSAQASRDAWAICRTASLEDRHTFQQVAVASGLALVAVTLILAGPAMLRVGPQLPSDRSWAVVTLIPQALPLAIPVALTLGILARVRNPAVSLPLAASVLTLALACTALSFVVMAWGMPAANRSFRAAVAGDVRPTRHGLMEMGLRDLSAQMAIEERALGQTRPRTEFTYQLRFAVPFASFGLSFLALTIPRGTGLKSRIARGAMACSLYYAVLAGGEHAMRIGAVSVTTAAWIPNALCLLIGGATLLWAHQRHLRSTGV